MAHADKEWIDLCVSDLQTVLKTNQIHMLTLCMLETPKRVLWQTVKTQMKCSIMHNAAFHQGLHCLLRLKMTIRDRNT